jgi:peptide alpha-N-acetyltransferase
MKRKEEAHAHHKTVLMKNLTHPTAWHVLGILHKESQEYAEARKSYLNAAKYDPDNVNILRDLANL